MLPQLNRRFVPNVGPRLDWWRSGALANRPNLPRWFWQPKNEEIGAVSCREVQFPKPVGLYVNMMPFVIGQAASIPRDLRQYLPLLASCPISRGEWGEIGYLTIDERPVDAGASQRRPGVHVESLLTSEAGWAPMDYMPKTLAWGQGQVLKKRYRDEGYECGHLEGGLFMATTVGGSCRVWNRRLDPLVFGQDLEPLRPFLGEGYDVAANELVWITDQTPHESCVLPSASPRQFFRFVTSKVDVWYADHSTPNPLGVQVPDHVQVVHGDKFAKPDRATRRQQLKDAAQLAYDAAWERRKRAYATMDTTINKKNPNGTTNGGTDDDHPADDEDDFQESSPTKQEDMSGRLSAEEERAADVRKVAAHVASTTSTDLRPRGRGLMVMENPFDTSIKKFPDYEE